MEAFWKRRAEEELPGRPWVALIPDPKLLESEARSKGTGEEELKGQVSSHITCMHLGESEAAELEVYTQ